MRTRRCFLRIVRILFIPHKKYITENKGDVESQNKNDNIENPGNFAKSHHKMAFLKVHGIWSIPIPKTTFPKNLQIKPIVIQKTALLQFVVFFCLGSNLITECSSFKILIVLHVVYYDLQEQVCQIYCENFLKSFKYPLAYYYSWGPTFVFEEIILLV